MLHESKDGTGLSAWDEGNIPFMASARTKCRLNCNCTLIEYLIDVIVCHNYMKNRWFWYVKVQSLLWFRAKNNYLFFSHLLYDIHMGHNLNGYVVNHLHHREQPNLTYPTGIWLHAIESNMSISDRLLDKQINIKRYVDIINLSWKRTI